MTIYNMHTFDCAWLFSDPGSAAAQRNMRITTANGPVIESITYFSASGLGRGKLANAHDDARSFRSAAPGAFGQPLESVNFDVDDDALREARLTYSLRRDEASSSRCQKFT